MLTFYLVSSDNRGLRPSNWPYRSGRQDGRSDYVFHDTRQGSFWIVSISPARIHHTKYSHLVRLINILKGANQPVPDDLLKFGTTVKKKQHDMYGAFFKDVDMNEKSTKITFD